MTIFDEISCMQTGICQVCMCIQSCIYLLHGHTLCIYYGNDHGLIATSPCSIDSKSNNLMHVTVMFLFMGMHLACFSEFGMGTNNKKFGMCNLLSSWCNKLVFCVVDAFLTILQG